ncbi:hypothetical protein BD770DRAFT_412631 [Pilaira anomala]|nr:hypothetical protein BD770DRAFT_412631 [Pilaira anomala]
MTWLSAKLLLIVITLLTVCAQISEAFCIHNRMEDLDTQISVYQVDMDVNLKFKKQIMKGESECCDWKDKSCNRSRTQGARVEFNIDVTFGNVPNQRIRAVVKCDAGDAINVEGSSSEDLKVVCQDSNGGTQDGLVRA